MPELPEVEVTRLRLEPFVLGRPIAKVATTADSYFFLTRPHELQRRLVGRTVTGLERRGKYLLAKLDDGSRLLLHLGMTGQLFTQSAQSPRLLRSTAPSALRSTLRTAFEPDGHTHLQLVFADGGESVFFRDVRKFGKVRWLAQGESDPRLDKLGVDALQASGADLYPAARARRTPIKSLLLDQGVLAGVGNIYADEALFAAGVRPTRAAYRVSGPSCDLLVNEVKRVLLRSIETGGSSISDYVTPDGSDGGYQDERRVYARTGEPCLRCGTAIKRVVIAQRSSHYCPSCQR
jgi:formamidopyrimidine-DNA glycosylase